MTIGNGKISGMSFSAFWDRLIFVRDTAAQRMSMYFIIARNRSKAGFDILLPAAWKEEISGSTCWALAKQICRELSKNFEGLTSRETKWLSLQCFCSEIWMS